MRKRILGSRVLGTLGHPVQMKQEWTLTQA